MLLRDAAKKSHNLNTLHFPGVEGGVQEEGCSPGRQRPEVIWRQRLFLVMFLLDVLSHAAHHGNW